MSIVDELIDLFESEITVEYGTLTGNGVWTASGASSTPKCRIEEGARLVRNFNGQEVVSSVFIIIADVLASNDPSLVRFTLPSRFPNGTQMRAIRIDPVSDETGPVFTEVSLP